MEKIKAIVLKSDIASHRFAPVIYSVKKLRAEEIFSVHSDQNNV